MFYELWTVWPHGDGQVGCAFAGRFRTAKAAWVYARAEWGAGTFVLASPGGEVASKLRLGGRERRGRPAWLDGSAVRTVEYLADGTLSEKVVGPLPAA